MTEVRIYPYWSPDLFGLDVEYVASASDELAVMTECIYEICAAIGAGLGALGAGAGKVVGKGLSLAGKVLNPKTVQNIAARQIEGAVGIPKTATSETIGQTLMKEEVS